MRTRRLGGIVAALALLTAACGGGNGSSSDDTGDVETVIDVRDPQGSVEGYEGALEDTTLTACGEHEGRFRAEGELTNPTNGTRAYRIYVSVMDEDETRAIVQVDIDPIDAGGSRMWGTDVDLDDDGYDCWLRVERFPPSAD